MFEMNHFISLKYGFSGTLRGIFEVLFNYFEGVKNCSLIFLQLFLFEKKDKRNYLKKNQSQKISISEFFFSLHPIYSSSLYIHFFLFLYFLSIFLFILKSFFISSILLIRAAIIEELLNNLSSEKIEISMQQRVLCHLKKKKINNKKI